MPEDQWSEDARLWMVRALLKEAGGPLAPATAVDKEVWLHNRNQEYTAIMFVLYRRWKLYENHYPTLTGMVREYCTGLTRPRTQRHKLYFNLMVVDTAPRFWDKRVSWKRTKALLDSDVLPLVDDFAAGKLRDPYEGMGAMHWGSKTDKHLKYRLKQLPGFNNRFYKNQ